MPCCLCGARPKDPACGGEPWKRGVRRERQVLICPDCLVSRDWKAELDRCGRCRSTFLISRLGESRRFPRPRNATTAASSSSRVAHGS